MLALYTTLTWTFWVNRLTDEEVLFQKDRLGLLAVVFSRRHLPVKPTCLDTVVTEAAEIVGVGYLQVKKPLSC